MMAPVSWLTSRRRIAGIDLISEWISAEATIRAALTHPFLAGCRLNKTTTANHLKH
jgi:hypothetical protein